MVSSNARLQSEFRSCKINPIQQKEIDVDIYTRAPVNKLARVVTSQGGVSSSVEANTGEQYSQLNEIKEKVERLAFEIGLNGWRKSTLNRALAAGAVNAKDPKVIEMKRLYSLYGRLREDIQKGIHKHVDHFYDLKEGDRFAVYTAKGKFRYTDKVVALSLCHFKGTDGQAYSKKTGKTHSPYKQARRIK